MATKAAVQNAPRTRAAARPSRPIGLHGFVGESPELRLWDFLAEMSPYDYSVSQVSKILHLSRYTVRNCLQTMVKGGSVVQSRTLGKSRLYALSNVRLNKSILTAMLTVDRPYETG